MVDKISELRGKWAVAKPARADYTAVVTYINPTKLVGKNIVFERGPRDPITHMAYTKPTMDEFLVDLKSMN